LFASPSSTRLAISSSRLLCSLGSPPKTTSLKMSWLTKLGPLPTAWGPWQEVQSTLLPDLFTLRNSSLPRRTLSRVGGVRATGGVATWGSAGFHLFKTDCAPPAGTSFVDPPLGGASPVRARPLLPPLPRQGNE